MSIVYEQCLEEFSLQGSCASTGAIASSACSVVRVRYQEIRVGRCKTSALAMVMVKPRGTPAEVDLCRMNTAALHRAL